jgi:hypothetical protein
VKVVRTEDGYWTILAFNRETGEFEQEIGYLLTIFASTGDVERVTQQEFEQRVEELRAQLKNGNSDRDVKE